MKEFINRMKEENAGAMVENVIVLPFVFIVLYFMIMTAFMVHDMCAIEAAAQRGIVYGSHCISECNYKKIAGQDGELDVSSSKTFDFSDYNSVINVFKGNNVEDPVEKEVKAILKKTRLPWKKDDSVTVDCKQENHFFYQELCVTIEAGYDAPKLFEAFGLETAFEYSATASTRTTNPDEFIRNCDLVVDIIVEIDNKLLGGKGQKAIDKIAQIGEKVKNFFSEE